MGMRMGPFDNGDSYGEADHDSGPLGSSGRILGQTIHGTWSAGQILYLLDKALYGTRSERVMELAEELADLLHVPKTEQAEFRVRDITRHFANPRYNIKPRSEMPVDKDRFFNDILNSQRNRSRGDGEADDELAEMPSLVLVFHGGPANGKHFPLRDDSDVPEFFCAWDRSDTLANGEVKYFDPRVARVSALGEIPNSYFSDGYAGDIAWYRDSDAADDTGKLIYSCAQVMSKSGAESHRPAGTIAQKDESGLTRELKGRFITSTGSESGSYWISDKQWSNAVVDKAHEDLFQNSRLSKWVSEKDAFVDSDGNGYTRNEKDNPFNVSNQSSMSDFRFSSGLTAEQIANITRMYGGGTS